jgi:putative heme-binding domain-containing protein
MERLVHGLRVPYSFEYDPFGQLWLLSNGEGNPNRFVRVIDGVDYHCYSRPAVDSDWLSGKHPLAPPCFSLPSGACTQLVRYYGAAFPESYQGSLLLDNWGAHGFNGGNRAIFRYVPDDRGTITSRETFLSCADPHFRPSHVVLDPDGNLLVADWYGRDDESDLTGRIWRVKYTGPDRPTVQHRLDGDGWNDDRYAVAALGSPHHLIRDKAIQELIAHGPRVIDRLADHAASAREPLGAANALWVLLRIGTPQAQAAIASGARHADWRVRRLAVNILRRYRLDSAAAVARQLGSDDHPAVRLEAALAHSQPEAIRASLLAALKHGADRDEHLRYEAAWHLAKHADSRTFAPLLSSLEETIRLTGLIAIDIACFEGFASKPLALKALAHALEDPERKTDHELLLTLAQLNGDPSIGAALEKLLARTDLPPRLIARALLVLRSKTFSPHQSLSAAATRRFLDELEKGSIKLKLSDAAERTLFFELLEAAGPTEFTLKQLGLQLTAASPVRSAALGLARKFGSKASGLAEPLWPRALDPRGNPLDRLEMVATLACIEASPTKANWERLLADDNALVRFEAVREWRHFKDKPELVEALVRRVPDLLKHDRAGKDDLAVVLRQLAVPAAVLDKLGLPEPDTDKDQLATRLLAAAAKVPLAERQQKVLLGRRVFERTGCVKCHTTVTDNTLLAPSLKGIATAQKVDYLVESVLHPSKIIKTGYESEQVLTVQGKVLSGLIKEDGAFLRILTAEGETRLAKKDVAERAVQKVSIMPEGQEKLISFPEFLDLLIYLLSFK